jgi:hypothetical protein
MSLGKQKMFNVDLRKKSSLGARLLVGGVSAVALTVGALVAQSLPTSGPAENGEPEWFILQQGARGGGAPGGAPGAGAPGAAPGRGAAAAGAPGRGAAPGAAPAGAPAGAPGAAAGRGGRGGGGPIEACVADAARMGVDASDRNEMMKRWKEVSPACVKALETPTLGPTTVDRSGNPTCVRSVICMSSNGQGISWNVNPSGLYNGTNNVRRVQWRSNPLNLGYKPEYPFTLIQGAGGAVSIGIDSKDNLWVVQRSQVGTDSISKFDPSGKRLLTLGDSVVGHFHKAHGMNVDANDNAYFSDESGAVIVKVSPDGKVLGEIGTRGKRGDWDEAKGQRLLWDPVSIAFDPRNGDMYIGEGHGAESPNDRQSGDPWNTSGAARVIRLDKDGKFINQIYGNMMGAGHFWMAHDVAIDPTNGDLWIGDREEYRIVIYTNSGEYKKTLQMRNLVCNISFDPKTGDPWIGTGLDSQFLRLNRDGKVLGVIGNGPGGGDGQIGETGYIRWDSKGNMYAGSTTQSRVVKWVPPQNQK